MKITQSPRIGLAAMLLAMAPSLYSQTLDWGAWDSSGTGLYGNGDSIVISGLVNGSVTAVYNETSFPHVIVDAAFPYDNAPGVNEHGFFHNASPTTTDWSILIDLSGFTLGADSVIGFSNLDGRSVNDLSPGFATIRFLDSSGTPVSVSSASLLGTYDVTWQEVPWDADSTFDTATGRWDVIPDVGSAHPAGGYYAAVGDAFFLTNLPSNIEKIIYTKSGGTDYAYDSTLFYAGNAVPEPSGSLLVGLAGMACVLRRRRTCRDQ